VAEFLYAITPLLKTLGAEPIIYAGDKSFSQLVGPSQTEDGITVYNGPIIKPGWFYSRQKLAPILQLCQTAGIELVHAQGTYTAGFMAMQIHKRLHIPYVVTSHSDILSANSKRINRSNVKQRCRHILKSAALVTHLTPMMAEVSHHLWDTKSKSMIIGNGIDCAMWRPYATLPEKNYLLAIGRLERGKGFMFSSSCMQNYWSRTSPARW
jgi:glycosyltransferase involved in cell wall biosynthesis